MALDRIDVSHRFFFLISFLLFKSMKDFRFFWRDLPTITIPHNVENIYIKQISVKEGEDTKKILCILRHIYGKEHNLFSKSILFWTDWGEMCQI